MKPAITIARDGPSSSRVTRSAFAGVAARQGVDPAAPRAPSRISAVRSRRIAGPKWNRRSISLSVCASANQPVVARRPGDDQMELGIGLQEAAPLSRSPGRYCLGTHEFEPLQPGRVDPAGGAAANHADLDDRRAAGTGR